jgi:glycosyltransferase involved in cell wall biosynthesis
LKRVAFVVPRYGAEIGGGAEEECRRLAELLAADVDVTVLTSCALDYRTWADHYPPGEAQIGGVRVLRFPVAAPRDLAAFDALSPGTYARPEDLELGHRWMRAQGPDVPGIAEHLRLEGDAYDAVCVLPYLYATAPEAIAIARDRAVLVPLAHDEPPLRLRIFDEMFARPGVLVFNTPEERAIVERRFGVDDRPRFTIPLTVDEPPPSDPARFRREFGVEGPYLLALGRIEPAKGSDVVLARFAELRRHRPDLQLVLVGRRHMALPDDLAGVVVTGYVDDQAKHDAITGAAVVLLASPYESLSIVALEAWSHARPTLANAASDVLVGQSRRSGGGLWYADPYEFHAGLALLLDNPPLAAVLGAQGRRYVAGTGGWDAVRRAWLEVLLSVPSVPPAAR